LYSVLTCSSAPLWVTGLLALLAGVMLVMERFGLRVDRK
jgi:uncharacterized membrane protein HdeD (DUF308 family)